MATSCASVIVDYCGLLLSFSNAQFLSVMPRLSFARKYSARKEKKKEQRGSAICCSLLQYICNPPLSSSTSVHNKTFLHFLTLRLVCNRRPGSLCAFLSFSMGPIQKYMEPYIFLWAMRLGACVCVSACVRMRAAGFPPFFAFQHRYTLRAPRRDDAEITRADIVNESSAQTRLGGSRFTN